MNRKYICKCALSFARYNPTQTDACYQWHMPFRGSHHVYGYIENNFKSLPHIFPRKWKFHSLFTFNTQFKYGNRSHRTAINHQLFCPKRWCMRIAYVRYKIISSKMWNIRSIFSFHKALLNLNIDIQYPHANNETHSPAMPMK